MHNEFLANPANLLVVLGVGFFVANLRLLYQFLRFRRLRSSALLTWPAGRPPFSSLVFALGAVLSVIIVYKLAFLRMSIINVFGETMMLVYYVYAMPLSAKIGRGFYEDGIWADTSFIPYNEVGGISWREGERQITLIVISRLRNLARRLIVPIENYSAARRLLRDKIAAHDIHFSGTGLDLGDRDERDQA